jgi:hypothetical protein
MVIRFNLVIMKIYFIKKFFIFILKKRKIYFYLYLYQKKKVILNY